MPEIQYPTNPNSDTAFVVQEDGTKNRALMTAPQDTSTLELPKNANSCKGYVTVDGKKQRVILTADIGGGSGDEYLPLAGGTMTGDIAFSKTGYNDKVVGNHNGDLRIGTSTTPSNNDLFISTGSGSDRSISFGDGNGGQLGSGTAKFERTYTQKLNNGADIAIPVVAGKMAEQVSTMPTAGADELGNIYQFTGTTDANYTNGYFYKCVSDGQDPATYSWTRVDVQPAGATYTAGTGIDITSGVISVAAPTLVNSATASGNLVIGNLATDNGCSGATVLGNSASVVDRFSGGSVVIGSGSNASGGNNIAVGENAHSTGANGIAIGYASTASASRAIQFGSGGTNSDANTFKVANANGNFEIMSADGTIPADRLTHAINKYSTMPTAASTNEGWIVQFTGTTDSTYTHGYLYECKAQGTDPETYAWEEVSFGGGSSYTAGTGIDITNDVISVTDPVLVNQKDLSTTNSIAVLYSGQQPTRVGNYCIVFGGPDFVNASDYVIKIGGAGRVAGSYSTLVGYGTGPSGVRQVTYGVCVGYQSSVGKTSSGTGVGNIAIGATTTSFENYSITIGYNAAALAQGAIQIGHYHDPNDSSARTENNDANTFKVANANGNFMMMDANGNLPADRLASTTGLADGNYRLRCTITNGVPTLSWVAE